MFIGGLCEGKQPRRRVDQLMNEKCVVAKGAASIKAINRGHLESSEWSSAAATELQNNEQGQLGCIWWQEEVSLKTCCSWIKSCDALQHLRLIFSKITENYNSTWNNFKGTKLRLYCCFCEFPCRFLNWAPTSMDRTPSWLCHGGVLTHYFHFAEKTRHQDGTSFELN